MRDHLKDHLNKRSFKRPHVMRDHLKDHLNKKLFIKINLRNIHKT